MLLQRTYIARLLLKYLVMPLAALEYGQIGIQYIKNTINDIIRGRPLIEGIFILNKGTALQEELLKLLNQKQSPFMIYGDGKMFIECDQIQKKINYLYINNIHIYLQNKIPLCYSQNQNNHFIATIASFAIPPFQFSLFNNDHLHFYISGTYNNFTLNSVLSQVQSLPKASTIIITAATTKFAIQSVSDEIILHNIDHYNDNPYLKYLEYVVTNPENNIIFINTGHSIQYYSADLDTLKDFSTQGIIHWQKQTIQSFLDFFQMHLEALNGRNEIEFMMRLYDNDTLQHNNTLQYNLNAILTDNNVTRYQELLFFRFIAREEIDNVKILLNSGVSIKAQLLNGFTVLHILAHIGNVKLLSFCLDFGLSPNIANNEYITPLMLAVALNHLSISQQLLIFDADINAQNIKGETPLMIASAKGLMDMTKFLLQHNAQTHLKNYDNLTAMDVAIEQFHFHIVKLLIDYFPDRTLYQDLLSEFQKEPIQYILYNNIRVNTVLEIINNIKINAHHYIAFDILQETTIQLIYTIKSCIESLDSHYFYNNLMELCGDINI